MRAPTISVVFRNSSREIGDLAGADCAFKLVTGKRQTKEARVTRPGLSFMRKNHPQNRKSEAMGELWLASGIRTIERHHGMTKLYRARQVRIQWIEKRSAEGDSLPRRQFVCAWSWQR
jgi:hypothetical protein